MINGYLKYTGKKCENWKQFGVTDLDVRLELDSPIG